MTVDILVNGLSLTFVSSFFVCLVNSFEYSFFSVFLQLLFGKFLITVQQLFASCLYCLSFFIEINFYGIDLLVFLMFIVEKQDLCNLCHLILLHFTQFISCSSISFDPIFIKKNE